MKEDKKRLITAEEFITELRRATLSRMMGMQYSGSRNIYEALGYPKEEELTFEYYWNKYDRQDIATAIIDRPAEATWKGEILVTEPGEGADDSALAAAWEALDDQFAVKDRLLKLDKISGVGRYGLLLLGLDDVMKVEDWKRPAAGTRKLKYIKQISEGNVEIEAYEKKSNNPRYGLPRVYRIKTGTVEGTDKELLIHYTRLIHVNENNLVSEIYGRPRLKPIVNRLEDLEKLLGGDAEMFWRGARPGYHVQAQEGFEMGEPEVEALSDELDKYEHDLRRFINAKGVDLKSLEQQISDPLNHIDAQLQAISAQTGIPKRVLIGSERGELSSSQDKDQWLSLVATRQTEFAEPSILRPFINRMMEFKILPKVKEYVVEWPDVFAPSELEKVELGSKRAAALKIYSESVFAAEIIPPSMAGRYLFGLSPDQVEEMLAAAAEEAAKEDRSMAGSEPSPVPEPPEE